MRTVTVTGHGSSTVTPDRAVLRVAVVRHGPGVAQAYEAMTADVGHLVEIALRHTRREHVASSGITVNPWHDRDGRHDGYQARHGHVVGCSDLAEAGALLAELAREIGDGLAVDSVALEASDDSAAAGRAREAAFGDARQRAAALARMAGLGLGAVQTMVEGAAVEQPYGSPRLALMSSSGGIEPGETALETSVTVVWELVEA